MGKSSKIINTILSIVLWIVVIIAAFFSIVTLSAKSEDGVSYLGGYAPMTVLTDSMRGEFEEGDLIIVKKVENAWDLREGDIISFWTLIDNKKQINTHRIVEVNPSEFMIQFRTKGDANAVEDSIIISENDIVGKYVTKIPVAGKVLGVLSSSIGFLLIIILPLLVFFVWQLYRVIMIAVQLKKEAVMDAEESSRKSIEDEVRAKIQMEEEIRAKIQMEEELRKKLEQEIREKLEKEKAGEASDEVQEKPQE